MTRIARHLDKRGYGLRTGGAKGADTAFERGSKHSEVYLPKPEFRGRKEAKLSEPTREALLIAAKYHPRWDRCSEIARLLHGRNSHIILGPDLRSPAAFVICWHTGSGGTTQGVRVAKGFGIAVYNLYERTDSIRLAKFLEGI